MELLFVTLGGALLGLGFRYVLPGRGTHGVLLLPGVGAVVASAVWAVLTWAGWKFDGGWIWVVSLVAAGVVPALVGIFLSRERARGDVELLAQLSKAPLPVS
jgi:hypothetical protein